MNLTNLLVRKVILQYFIMTALSLTPAHLRQIFQIEYQLRSNLQHQTAIDFIQHLYGKQYGIEQAKLLSFFATPPSIPEDEQYQLDVDSVVIKLNERDNTYSKETLRHKIILTHLNTEIFLIIDTNSMRKCEAIDWHIPEFQVKFLRTCTLLSQIPRKRLYPILRQSSIQKYRYGQLAFKEGDSMKNCYYLIRQGQFCFCKKDNMLNKNLEVLSFKAGYIFQHESRQNCEQTLHSFTSFKIITEPKFNYTVKCKSSKGVVYCIEKQFFNSQLLKFCQEELHQHLHNQLKFLTNIKEKVQHRRSYSQVSLNKRPFSQAMTPLTAATISSARQNQTRGQDKKILDLFQKPVDYRTIKQTMPKRDRLYSKLQLKKLYPNPEEDQSDALIWKKARCNELRKLTKSSFTKPLTRGQVLYDFTKFTIRFEKVKRKILKP